MEDSVSHTSPKKQLQRSVTGLRGTILLVTTRRSYDDGCATAHGLDLIGDRWGLLVVRELLLGAKRFSDLRRGLPGISPNVLTQRLEGLEQSSIVRRRKLSPPASAWVYELTEWGLDLEPVIMALGRWAVRSPALMQGNPIGVDALILSFRTMFDATAAAGFDASIELRFGDDHFRAKIGRGRLEIVRDSAADADAIIDTHSNALAAVVYGGRKLAEAMRSGEVRVEGDKSVVKRFVTLFPLP
jgi:DNA-binding HxlR family transcriptional regulator/putative sterol carrier protein